MLSSNKLNEKLNQSNNKFLKIMWTSFIFIVLGFIVGTILSYMITGTKPSPNPKPPIPTNYSLEQKNYEDKSYEIDYYHNGTKLSYGAVVLNNGSVLSVNEKNKYFLNDTLIDMNIEYIFIFNGNNIQYGLININNKTILVNTDNILKPLQTLNFKIYQYNIATVVFNSFINIFTEINNKQECIKIDIRSFDYKEIKMSLNNNPVNASFLIQQGNIYTVDNKENLYVIDTETQKQNLDNFYYEKLFNLGSNFVFGNFITFNDDTINNNLNNSKNYNIFLRNYKDDENSTISMVDKNGEIKFILKDYNKINSYIYAFDTQKPNKISLINLSKSVFSDKEIIFQKEINNKLLENSLLFIQSNNNNTYSIGIYNEINSLLDVITLNNNLNQNEIFKIEHVNNFNFKWLNSRLNTLQIAKRPIVFTFQGDCYYITTPNNKSILLWKNEKLIKEYKSNLDDNRNFSPFLLNLKNIPIIVTKNIFFINDKKYDNTTITTELDTLPINISNDKIWIKKYTTPNITSIIYLKPINEN